ncbi:MAG: fimbria/pilus periplasmic chaperone [Geminicoccaceae bacterium]
MSKRAPHHRRRSGKALFLTIPLLLAFLISGIADAQSVQPMAFDLEPVGAKARETLTISNTTEGTLTLEMTASAIVVKADGSEHWTPADENFLIFPPTAIIEPGKIQAVQVQYVGESELDESVSYRVSVKQVPVDLGNVEESQIQVLVNFNTLANVVPSEAKALPVIEEIADAADAGFWDVTLRNAGNRYFGFSKSSWYLSGGGQDHEIHGKEIAKINNSNLVLPNSVRTIRVPAPEGFVAASTEIEVIAR